MDECLQKKGHCHTLYINVVNEVNNKENVIQTQQEINKYSKRQY